MVELREEIRQQLIGPGGPFELVEEEVLGEPMQVFAQRQHSLRELLQESALHGDKTYIAHGERRISYCAHLQLVASVATALAERYDIEPGDRVAILAANSAEWVIAFWATLSLGGIVAALNGMWTADEIRYGLENSQPKLLIGDRKRLARLAQIDDLASLPTLEIESQFGELERHAADAKLPSQPIAEDDPCLILYTSGTTGRPKGATVSHRALVGFVRTQSVSALERLMLAARSGEAPAGVGEPQPALCNLVTAPLFHLSGLYAAAIMMLAQGAKTVYLTGRFDPEEVMRLIEKEQVTLWSALGSAGAQLLAHPALGKYDLSSIRNIGFGGAPTSPDLQERLKRAFPNARDGLGLGYGLTESGGLGTAIGGAELSSRPTSAGRAAVANELEIRDARGNALPPGEKGEIFIRNPYLMLGYWRNPAATAETVLPGRWLATGDIGQLDEDGYLHIDSRARDMILRSGENIYPVEIEHRLEAHPAVQECAVVGVDHEDLGQEVKAIVVPTAGASIDCDALHRWAGQKLAAYKLPSVWEVREKPLPRNAAGKVLKKVLTGEVASTAIRE